MTSDDLPHQVKQGAHGWQLEARAMWTELHLMHLDQGQGARPDDLG